MNPIPLRPKLAPKVFTKTVLNPQRDSPHYGFKTADFVLDNEIPNPVTSMTNTL
jgi:hypothetical protein